jgi:asparagine synthase (glutamine-hydrolysing)
MSGIVGIYNLDGRPVEKSEIQKMTDTLAYRGPDGYGIWVEGPIALGCQLLRVTPESKSETQPFSHPRGNRIVFDGILHNREELLSKFQNSPEINEIFPDPAFALEAYAAFGERFVQSLIGDFALGIFDVKERKILLARDKIGIRPLYYYYDPTLFLFSTDIKALLTHSRVATRPNDEYLAEFLFLRLSGNDAKDSTFFDRISTLPPASLLTVSTQGISKQKYWDFDLVRPIHFKSLREYTDGFYHYFEQSVRRRLRSLNPVTVSLSGGLDSSSIFCMAESLRQRSPKLFPPVVGASYVTDDGSLADEKTYLSDIVQQYSVSIERVSRIRREITDGRKEEVWQTESPLLDNLRELTEPFYRYVKHSGSRIILSGNMGDQVLFDQSYLIDLFYEFKWLKLWNHLNEFRKWFQDATPKYFKQFFLRQLLKSFIPRKCLPYLQRTKSRLMEKRNLSHGYRQAFKELANRHLFQSVPVRMSFATAYAQSIYNEVKSRYNIFRWEWMNKTVSMHGLEVAYPFLDSDLLSYLLAIPGEAENWQGVPKGILRESLRGILPPRIRERRWKGDYTDFVNESVEHGLPQIAQRLESEPQIALLGYTDEKLLGNELKRARDRIGKGDVIVSRFLLELLGLELWLQVFFRQYEQRRGG